MTGFWNQQPVYKPAKFAESPLQNLPKRGFGYKMTSIAMLSSLNKDTHADIVNAKANWYSAFGGGTATLLQV